MLGRATPDPWKGRERSHIAHLLRANPFPPSTNKNLINSPLKEKCSKFAPVLRTALHESSPITPARSFPQLTDRERPSRPWSTSTHEMVPAPRFHSRPTVGPCAYCGRRANPTLDYYDTCHRPPARLAARVRHVSHSGSHDGRVTSQFGRYAGHSQMLPQRSSSTPEASNHTLASDVTAPFPIQSPALPSTELGSLCSERMDTTYHSERLQPTVLQTTASYCIREVHVCPRRVTGDLEGGDMRLARQGRDSAGKFGSKSERLLLKIFPGEKERGGCETHPRPAGSECVSQGTAVQNVNLFP